MQIASLIHRPKSEQAYLKSETQVVLRFRSARDDVERIILYYADPYLSHVNGMKQAELRRLYSTSYYDYWEVEVEEENKRLVYLFEVVGKDHQRLLYSDRGVIEDTKENRHNYRNYFHYPYFHDNEKIVVPKWAKETVWYQIFPERFSNGNKQNDPKDVKKWGSEKPTPKNFFGGDLKGIMNHLDDLSALGVTGLYLNPIFQSPSNHKYDTTDYLKIDPSFGTKEDLIQLVQKAHEKGMKVMLDGVFNHVGDQSKIFQDVLDKQDQSKYVDWFHVREFPISFPTTKEEKLKYETFAFTPKMPKWNTENPEVEAYLLKVALYWIKESDIDGWRLDVADEVDHHFWRDFRRAVRQLKPDFYILGESSHSSYPWLDGTQWDGIMNYLYTNEVVTYFKDPSLPASSLVEHLIAQLMSYPRPISEAQFNTIDSHDEPRLLTVLDGNKNLMKAVVAFNFLQPGSPVIYYGDEIGMIGGRDPDNRRTMIWQKDKQDLDLFNFYQNLIQFYTRHLDTLAEGELSFNYKEERGLFSIYRKKEEKVVGIFNSSTEEKKLTEDIRIELAFNFNEKNNSLAPNGFILGTKKGNE